MTEPATLVCVLVINEPKPIRGSLALPCSRCDRLCWVSPSSFQVEHRIFCLGCALHVAKEAAARGEPLQVADMLPGQWAELQEAMKDESQ